MRKKQQGVKESRIILTGGHAATTALSVVEELVRRSNRNKKWDIFWIGPAYAMEGSKIPTLASYALPKKGVKFHSIVAGRLQRRITKWSLISLIKFPVGFAHALVLINRIKPDVVLSFGGYAAFPVVIISWLYRIPVILHDQTYSFNRANKLSIPFAKVVAISRQSSSKYYPKKKVILTGNPIMTQMTLVQAKTVMSKPPSVYITGGSTGARSLNRLVAEIIFRLVKDFKIIHQVGHLDYRKHKNIKNRLPKKMKDNYEVYDSIDPMQVDGVLARADFVVGRSGANTVSEIIATKRPTILIPLVIGKHDEQRKNAEYAATLGIAKVLNQDGLTAGRLLSEIESFRDVWPKMNEKFRKIVSPDINASSKLVDVVESVAK